MGFDPLEEEGIPIDRQLRPWSELNVEPGHREQFGTEYRDETEGAHPIEALRNKSKEAA